MTVPVDSRLVAGFQFGCLPRCGLCCYTSPAVAPDERVALIRLDPAVPLVDTARGWAQIASRPNGGACHFLQRETCRAHSVRPATCREFPLTVHAGPRVQVSVVLSCPGVSLDSLPLWRHAPPAAIEEGMASEMAAVATEVSRAEADGQIQWAARQRRQVENRLRKSGQWQSEEEVRAELSGLPEVPIDRLQPLADLPDASAPLVSLPMFYDASLGRVAWREHAGGMEFVTLYESGGIDRYLGVYPPLLRAPSLEPEAFALLEGYRAYLLERDATIQAVYAELVTGRPGSPVEGVRALLEEVTSGVVRMAALRRSLTSGRRGDLTLQDVASGIRAMDMDLLDRPTIGIRL